MGFNIRTKTVKTKAGKHGEAYKNWKVFKRKKYFVHSKVDDCLLFESYDKNAVDNFVNTTDLR